MRRLFGAAVVAGLVTAGSVGAQNLTNPGFETGDLTGWTANLGPCGYPGDVSVTNAAAHTGTYSLSITRMYGCDAWAVQPYDFIAGHDYTVDLWAMFIGSPTDDVADVTVEYGSPSRYSYGIGRGGMAAGTWAELSVELRNTPGPGVLWVGARNSAGYVLLDDITIRDTSTVPEPTSLVLLGTGLFGLVPFVKRRLSQS